MPHMKDIKDRIYCKYYYPELKIPLYDDLDINFVSDNYPNHTTEQRYAKYKPTGNKAYNETFEILYEYELIVGI